MLTALLVVTAVAALGQAPAPPKILLDQPLRAVEYQLNRLTPDELSRVERKDDDARYRPVYVALLTRPGQSRETRTESVRALAKLDKTTEPRVLLEALGKVSAEDATVVAALVSMLCGQPVAALRADRASLVAATDESPSAPVLRGAYGGLMIGDGAPAQAWQAAASHEGHLVELLRSLPHLGAPSVLMDALRAQLYDPVAGLVVPATDAVLRNEAIASLGWTRRDSATFDRLAALMTSADPAAKAAAVRSLKLLPESAWTASAVEPLARAVVAMVRSTPAERRTDPDLLDAVQLGERLAAVLPGDVARGIRRDLRALGVQVVHIGTLPEQLKFDLNWFAVQAGASVQIVFANTDAMPHNLVVGQPGSVEAIGTAGGAMPMPADPAVKPFVPDSPLVLLATRLLQQGDRESLGFTAPAKPGEYVFVCTFPGHWIRMYGVMLVVENLDAWEATPSVPIDPVTKKPFASQR